jgi:hypothetical protein
MLGYGNGSPRSAALSFARRSAMARRTCALVLGDRAPRAMANIMRVPARPAMAQETRRIGPHRASGHWLNSQRKRPSPKSQRRKRSRRPTHRYRPSSCSGTRPHSSSRSRGGRIRRRRNQHPSCNPPESPELAVRPHAEIAASAATQPASMARAEAALRFTADLRKSISPQPPSQLIPPYPEGDRTWPSCYTGRHEESRHREKETPPAGC